MLNGQPVAFQQGGVVSAGQPGRAPVAFQQNVTIENTVSNEVTARVERRPDTTNGIPNLKVTIERAVRDSILIGEGGEAIRQRFGANPQLNDR